jgi:hypothetical protein
MGEVELCGAHRAAGHEWGIDRFNGAKQFLMRTGLDDEHLVDRGGGKARARHIERATEPDDE